MNYAKMTKAELIEELKSLQSLHLSEPVSEKMEGALYESEERYKTLIENAPEAIVVHDVDENCFVELPSSIAGLCGAAFRIYPSVSVWKRNWSNTAILLKSW